MTDNIEFIEQLVIKTALQDKNYLASVFNNINLDYFENFKAAKIFGMAKDYFQEYHELVPHDVLINLEEGVRDDIVDYLREADSVDIDIAKNYEFILDTSEKWIKTKALEQAVMESVPIIQSRETDKFGKIDGIFKEALSKSLKFDMGLNYFDTLEERLQRKFNETDFRLGTYFPEFDSFINGGFPPKTLSVFIGRPYGGKSNFMVNAATRQALNKKNVIIFSLEMSEDMFAQRVDSIYAGIDINKIYTENKREFQRNLLENLTDKELGTLIIKEFPTGGASVNDLRTHLRECQLRSIPIHIVYCDYINLMKSIHGNKGLTLYEIGKRVAEELRALSFEFDIPIISVTQLNRGGSSLSMDSLEDTEFTDISESMGVIHTADFAAILGTSGDMQTYASEVHYKIVKNRLGGRAGEIGKFFLDAKSLKLYDASELDMWLNAAKISYDKRDLAERKHSRRRDNKR